MEQEGNVSTCTGNSAVYRCSATYPAFLIDVDQTFRFCCALRTLTRSIFNDPS